MYQDHDGNIVHHFNIPGRLSRLSVVADALVECGPSAEVPSALGPGAWERLDAATASGAFWELLHPSPFARPTARLDAFARELDLARGDDPLAAVRRINAELFERLTYSPKSTRVDSPIDDALESRKGVCQDFTHIMIALVRQLGVPCRYVSGYLFHQADGEVRSRGRLDARLGRGLVSRARVGRLRSDEQPRGRPSPHPRRDRPRLRGRAADPGRLQGIEHGAE